MRRYAAVLVAMLGSFAVTPALAQRTLGELLDAGAKLMTVEEFQAQVVQRTLAGPTPNGGRIEVVYTAGGSVQGRGAPSLLVSPLVTLAPITGEWNAADNKRICTSMTIGSMPGAPMSQVVLPPRCQHWLRLGDKYYLSDTDWDRSSKVWVREVKP